MDLFAFYLSKYINGTAPYPQRYEKYFAFVTQSPIFPFLRMFNLCPCSLFSTNFHILLKHLWSSLFCFLVTQTLPWAGKNVNSCMVHQSTNKIYLVPVIQLVFNSLMKSYAYYFLHTEITVLLKQLKV